MPACTQEYSIPFNSESEFSKCALGFQLLPDLYVLNLESNFYKTDK